MTRHLLAALALLASPAAFADLSPGKGLGTPVFKATKPANVPNLPACQKYRACAPAVELPECAPALLSTKPMKVGDVYIQRSKLKGQLTISGAFHAEAGCTEMACGAGNDCCNHCGGDLVLMESESRTQVRIALVDGAGNKLKAAGDDSLVCSPFTMDGRAPKGQPVIAIGEFTLEKDNMGLKNATLCRLVLK